MKVKIYVLIDPFTLKVRYIGRTRKDNLHNRLCEHLSKAKYHKKYGRKPSHRYNWINAILKQEARPYIRLLTTVNGWKYSHQVERCLIAKYSKSRNLVNKDDLGEGECYKVISQDQRNQISSTLKEGYLSGRIKSPTCKKTYAYNKQGEYLFEFDSAKEAAKNLNIDYVLLINQINGKAKQAKGYRFSYTKMSKLPDISLFRKSVSYKVTVITNTNERLDFGSMSSCYQHFNVFGGTTKKLFVNKLYGNVPYIREIYINGQLTKASPQSKKAKVITPDGEIQSFYSLRALAKKYRIHEGKSSTKRLVHIFNTKFKHHKLIID